MFRIGILGSDSSHAVIFSQLVNIEDKTTNKFLYPDCKVTAIYGTELKRTEEVAQLGRIEYIASNPEDLLDKVDAVMVVFRHGSVHLQYAMPFIEAGIPAWIDKPFTVTTEDARLLIETAQKNNTLLTGGSTCRFIDDLLFARNISEQGNSFGEIKCASINFPADLNSEYDGIHFYGSHLVDMTLSTFGHNPRSVTACENNGCVTAVLKYEKYMVTMNFIHGLNKYNIALYGDKGSMSRELDISMCYRLGMDNFIGMLREKTLPFPLEQLYKYAEVMNAIISSYKSGKEVLINDM